MTSEHKTYNAKPNEIERRWFVVDATDQVLGRLATRVATVLRGKHKPVFTRHADVGDFVIVTNAEKVKLTGNKRESKLYRRHTGYPGGLVEIPYSRLLETHPERAIEHAVKGMLPKGTLGRHLQLKLKVYKGDKHPHVSQKPEVLTVDGPIPVYMGLAPVIKGRPKKKKPAKAAAAGSKPAAKKVGARKKSAPKKSAPKKPAAKKEES
jgi:large subunit ribosomal protein L13